MVTRNCAGSDVDRSLFGEGLDEGVFGCNAHLLGAEASRPANFAHYYDMNSLYAASCEY
jgi:hypothetical protein